jgi:hypothetical protein
LKKKKKKGAIGAKKNQETLLADNQKQRTSESKIFLINLSILSIQ